MAYTIPKSNNDILKKYAASKQAAAIPASTGNSAPNTNTTLAKFAAAKGISYAPQSTAPKTSTDIINQYRTDYTQKNNSAWIEKYKGADYAKSSAELNKKISFMPETTAAEKRLKLEAQAEYDWVEYNRLLNADVKKAYAEVDNIDEQINKLNIDYARKDSIRLTQAERDSFENELGALQKKRAELKLDADNAKQMQLAAAYSKLYNDPDFREYAEQGSANSSNKRLKNAEKTAGEKSLYGYMDEDESSMYDYLLGKYGSDQAENFFEYLQNDLAMRKGEKRAKEKLDNRETDFGKTVAGVTYTLGAGLANSATKLYRSAQDVFGEADDRLTANEAGQAYVAEELDKLDGWVNRNVHIAGHNLSRTLADTAYNIGDNTLPFVIGRAIDLFAPGAGTVAATALFGANVYEGAKQEALAKGYGEDSARTYAALNTASETGLQTLLGGFAEMGGISQRTEKSLKNIGNAFWRAAATTGVNAAGEAIEESLQEVLTPMFENLAFNEKNKVFTKEVGENAAYAAIIASLTAFAGSGAPVMEIRNQETTGAYIRAFRDRNQEAYNVFFDEALNSEDADIKSLAEGLKSGKYKETNGNIGDLAIKMARSGRHGAVQTLMNTAASQLSDINVDAYKTFALPDAEAKYEDVAFKHPGMKVLNPVEQSLYELTGRWDDKTQKQAYILSRIFSGSQYLSEEDYTALDPADKNIQSIVKKYSGVDLSTSQDMRESLLEASTAAAETQAYQETLRDVNQKIESIRSDAMRGTELTVAGVKRGAKRGVIPPNRPSANAKSSAQNIANATAQEYTGSEKTTIGGIEYSHDDFIRDYKAQNGVTDEEAEAAWSSAQAIESALYPKAATAKTTVVKETANNGRSTGDQIRSNDPGGQSDMAERGSVSAVQSGNAGLQPSSDTGGRSAEAAQPGTPASDVRPGSEVKPEFGYIDEAEYDKRQQSFVAALKEDGFDKVTLAYGSLKNAAGQELDAVISGGDITIRWDNKSADVYQIGDHERIHRWIKAVYGKDPVKRKEFVMRTLRRAASENELRDIYSKYYEEYSKAYSSQVEKYVEQFGAAQSESFLEGLIYEEVLCDMFAGHDYNGAQNSRYTYKIEPIIEMSGIREQALSAIGMADTKAKPVVMTEERVTGTNAADEESTMPAEEDMLIPEEAPENEVVAENETTTEAVPSTTEDAEERPEQVTGNLENADTATVSPAESEQVQEASQVTPVPSEPYTSKNGYTLTENTERGSVEISFDGKPDEAIRNVLKANKFRWNSKSKLWYGKASREDIIAALDAAYESANASEASLKPVIPPAKTPSESIARDILNDYLRQGKALTAKELYAIADKAFGGTQAEGKYDRKDAYDAMELAVNKYLLETMQWYNTGTVENAQDGLKRVQDIVSKLPTQTVRNEEQQQFQQFSTPPNIAYLAAWVANINSNDFVLEPSAGIGGLASFPKAWGATVAVNELSKRRLEVLRSMGFDYLFNENAEQINNILPEDIKPTAVIMNPPFSSTAGRTASNKTSNAERHIDQALARLQENGRLVAIVGRGMADAAYSKYWNKVRQQYTIRANVRINGENYKKYGTTFDIQLVVIDKVGPQGNNQTYTGSFDDLAGLPKALEEIRNVRSTNVERNSDIASTEKSASPSSDRQPISGTVRAGSNSTAGGVELGDGSNPGTVGELGASDVRRTADDSVRRADRPGERGQLPGERNVVADTGDTERNIGEQMGRSDNGAPGNDGQQLEYGDGAGSDAVSSRSGEVDEKSRTAASDDGVYAEYITPELPVKGSKAHPAVLVESAAMSAVSMPKATYNPKLPETVIKNNLSTEQMVSIVYAGQAHQQILPDGNRKGFFIGDGTGVGKGRQISGIILDNFMQGRNKAVWISMNASLFPDAVRDWTDTTGRSKDEVHDFGKVKLQDKIKFGDGILFTTYDTLKTEKAGKSRLDQVVDWLGKDFDGVIAFDEAHNMGNLLGRNGKRGKSKGSAKAAAAVELQRRLPNARVVYVSATAATEVDGLAFASRLGLWGKGTAFTDVNDFVSKIGSSGLAAMELVVRDMKAMGVYDARSISYNGVNYDTVQHNLDPMQTEIYNTMSRAWQKTMRNVTMSLETTGGMQNSQARTLAIGQYYSAMQRFYNQVLTSMSMPSVIADIKKQLADNKSVVLQIVNTNQAEADRQIANIKASEGSLDDMDLTPRGVLINYLENYYPVNQYEEYTDEDGNIKSRPVVDSQGKPVLDREAVRKRDELIAEVNSLSIPDGPLEMLFNAFGTDQVAEITGRTRRVVPKKMPDGTISRVEESRSKTHTAADVQAFQDGEKRILVFSDAGGTGKSYHASRTAKNQQQRVHYVLQPGWVASKAVQGFGRTHRSNQASAPVYKLVTTNIKGQKRFTSTIARRLDQLGALTKGQRDTGSGMFGAMDNLETDTARDSLREFYRRLGKDQIDDINGIALLTKLGLKEKFTDEYGAFKLDENYSRDISTFLNRILALEVDEQNAVFDAFINIYETEMERAMQSGTLDTGMENVKADKIEIIDDKIIKEQKDSGASTHYVQAKIYKKPKVARTVEAAQKLRSGFVGIYKTTDGAVRAVFRMADKTSEYGEPQKQYRLIGPNIVKSSVWNENTLNKNAVPVDKSKWKSEWGEEVKKVPEYNEELKHMLTGTLLPIWDRLPKDGSTKVQRLIADDGKTYLGRIIDAEKIDGVLRQFSIGRTRETYTGQSIMDKAIKQGVKFNLVNYRAQLYRSRVSGEWRLEYYQPFNAQFIRYQYPGIIMENIGYQNRYFIPTGSEGIALLDKILADNPVATTVESTNDIDPGESYSVSDPSYENDPLKREVLDLFETANNDPDAAVEMLDEWANRVATPAPKTEQQAKPVIPPAPGAVPISEAQQRANREEIDGLINKYGALPAGENAARDFAAPARKDDGTYVRRFMRTAAEASGTPDRMIPRIEQEILSSAGSYARMTDARAMAAADKRFAEANGYQSVKDQWNGTLANPSLNLFPTKEHIALGERLYIEASNSGDTWQAIKTLADLAAMATQAGQIIQAIRMLKKMGPSGQLYYVEKAVERLNKQHEQRIANGTMSPIIINTDLAKAVILAKGEQAMNDAMDALIQDIADQVPVTLKDKLTAWRYLGMLGNVRTHARNFIGNAVFVPVRFTKDLLAAAGESLVAPELRTKNADALLHPARYAAEREFAAKDFEANKEYIAGNGKYDPTSAILRKRRIFNNKLLNWADKKNSKWLDNEDVIFMRSAYVSAMTQFIAARGIDVKNADKKTLNEARQYAAQEAKKATYRDFSALANGLNWLSRRVKPAGLVIDALYPFKQTPINIAKRGILEYSPIGLMKSATYGLYQLKSGKITAAEFIDNLAAGMSGSMVAVLGAALAAMGIARGPGDDDKEGDLEKAEGHQDYSIEIGNMSFTIDWLAPVSLPFFVGVQAYNILQERGEFSLQRLTEAMSLIAEPMLSLSMLDGINNLVESAKYSKNDATISMIGSAAASYAGQYIPTLLGQFARTIDPERRANYVDKNKNMGNGAQRFLQTVQGKIPSVGLLPLLGLKGIGSKEKMAYVDMWGRKDTNGSFLLRAFENFVSPAYINRIEETPVDAELTRLAKATGNSNVLPSEAEKKFAVDGKELNLTADEYEQYAISRGQMAYSLVQNLINDYYYAAMPDEMKAKAVEYALKYASTIAKQDVAPDYDVSTKWMERAAEAGCADEAILYQTFANQTGITGNELVAQMYDVSDDARGNLILATYEDRNSITDPNRKGYKYTLDDNAKSRLRELYDEYFWTDYYDLLYYSGTYAYGDLEGRVSLLKKLGENVRKKARTQLASELSAAGYVSEIGSTEIELLDDYLNW